jgi:hypothetical protein
LSRGVCGAATAGEGHGCSGGGVVFGTDAVAIFEVDGAALDEGVCWVGEDLLPFPDAVLADACEQVTGLVIGPFPASASRFAAFFGGHERWVARWC